MFPFYPSYPMPQPMFPWNPSVPTLPFAPPMAAFPESRRPTPLNDSFLSHPTAMVDKDPKTISTTELSTMLDAYATRVKRLHDRDNQQQTPLLLDTMSMLMRVQRTTLLSVSQNDFFALLRNPFIDILHQWSRTSSLSDAESVMFHHVIKLIRYFIYTADDISGLPLWLSDLTLLQAIAQCLINIASSDILFQPHSKHHFKYFTRLIDAYIHYQQTLTQLHPSDQDKLLPLVDPIIRCLTSAHYIDTFTSMPVDQSSMSTKQKFFLVKCPTFLTAYAGTPHWSRFSLMLVIGRLL